MVHKMRKKPERFSDLERYRMLRLVPTSFQVYGKHRLDNDWHVASQQRESKKDAEKDKTVLKYNPVFKPFYKEYKIFKVPASKSELSQREILNALKLKGSKRGAVESFVGTIAEAKWGGSLPFIKPF